MYGFIKIIFVSLILTVAGETFSGLTALEVPKLTGRVVDLVGTLTENSRTVLEERLANHEKETSNQVVVLIIPSLEGEILEEYSIKVASSWKLGQKKKDNGVLLLIAKEDRKLRIEVGYGLEGVLTDAKAARIIRNIIVPEFKKEEYTEGIVLGVSAILKTIEGTYEPPGDYDPQVLQNSARNFFAEMDTGKIFGFIFIYFVIGLFTFLGIIMGKNGWVFYFFLIPFWGIFSLGFFGGWGALKILTGYLILYPALNFLLRNTSFGKKTGSRIAKNMKNSARYSSSSRSSSGSSGSSSSGSFSGGGGSFGGGGSSGSW